MSVLNIGVLHPGEMGISVAAAAQQAGNTVYWASAGRSAQTKERAVRFQLQDSTDLAGLRTACTVIISVCPPHAAEDVAAQVAALNYQNIYVDANAISPDRTRRIESIVSAAGGTYVDGGIIGGPAWEPSETCLYLSGMEAASVAACFEGSLLETTILGDDIGTASALKMCYAAYAKGSTALLCAVLAASEALGVRQALNEQWTRDSGDLAAQAAARTTRVTAKAWRFAGEMEEISAAFKEAGVPKEFHDGAREIYQRLAEFKDAPDTPELESVLAALIQQD